MQKVSHFINWGNCLLPMRRSAGDPEEENSLNKFQRLMRKLNPAKQSIVTDVDGGMMIFLVGGVCGGCMKLFKHENLDSDKFPDIKVM